MMYPKFFKRLIKSLVIGGQSINYIFNRKISKNDLFEQLMEAGPGSFIIVLITFIHSLVFFFDFKDFSSNLSSLSKMNLSCKNLFFAKVFDVIIA